MNETILQTKSTSTPKYPRYADPDAQEAEHLVRAAWHLQQTGRDGMAERLACEAAGLFKDVAYDRKAGKKRLGRVSYLPAGILECPAMQYQGGDVALEAPPYAVPDPPRGTVAAKAGRTALNEALRNIEDHQIGLVSKLQIRSAASGRAAKPSGPQLASTLAAIRKVCACRPADTDDPRILAACGDALDEVFQSQPPYLDGITETGKDEETAWLSWLRPGTASELAKHLVASGYDAGTAREMILSRQGEQNYAMWPFLVRKDPYTEPQLITDRAWSAATAGSGAAGEAMYWWRARFAFAVSSAMRHAYITAGYVQANHVLSRIPDEAVVDMLTGMGIVLKGFEPDEDLYLHVAMGVLSPLAGWEDAPEVVRTAVRLAREELARWFDKPENQAAFTPRPGSYKLV